MATVMLPGWVTPLALGSGIAGGLVVDRAVGGQPLDWARMLAGALTAGLTAGITPFVVYGLRALAGWFSRRGDSDPKSAECPEYPARENGRLRG